MRALEIAIPLYFFADVWNEVVDDQQLGQMPFVTPYDEVTRANRQQTLIFLQDKGRSMSRVLMSFSEKSPNRALFL